MKIENIPLEQLIPAEYNPRKDLKPGDPEYEKLRRSIEEFGLVEPVVWNRRTSRVVGGHQRLKILRALGHTETECVVVDLPEEQEKALNIALNKIQGDWDMEALESLVRELELLDVDLSVTGFEDEEIRALLDEMEDDITEEDDFDPDAAVPDEPVTKPGDLWILGPHRLTCGDATRKEDMSRLMEGKQADICITDPPYNVEYVGKTEDALTMQNDRMTEDEFAGFLRDSFSNIFSVLDDGAALYVFHADTGGLMIRQAFIKAGFHLANVCIWVKNSLVMGRSDYQWQHEPVLYGWKPTASHEWYSDRKQTTLWHFDRPVRSADHPTMKPLALCAYPLRNSSRFGDIVLDPFGGSGSTMMAADQTGRVCRMMEIDSRYCDVIIRRYLQYKGTDAPVKLIRDNDDITVSIIGSFKEGIQ